VGATCADCKRSAGFTKQARRRVRCLPCAEHRRQALMRVSRLRNYHRHRARYSATRRLWERTHREKCRARFRRSYWRHPEKRRLASRQWAALNPARARENIRRYRRGLAARFVAPYHDSDIFLRDRWTCGLCGRPVDESVPRSQRTGATIDHVVPVSLGGTDEPRNVRLAHRTCNSARGASLAPRSEWPPLLD
jgi:hypothetical protein